MTRESRAVPPAGSNRPWWRVLLLFLLRAALGATVLLLFYCAWLDAVVTRAFEAHRFTVPARVFARPLELQAGMPLTLPMLLGELDALGYRRVASPAGPGEYALLPGGTGVRLVTRGFRFPDGTTVAERATAQIGGARVERLVAAGRVLRLEPAEVGTLDARTAEDRVLMRLADRPRWLVEALLATEDRDFFGHHGVSPRGMLRAFATNVSAGETQQGGSTLTQQLVKNLFLGSERTYVRKLNEALMAILLELHYDKQVILETYLNEVFLGQAGPRAVHGFALASRYYFGRPVQELQLHEVALLAGLVKGPSQYNPWKHADRARARRNAVIDALVATGGLGARVAAAAKSAPLGVLPQAGLRLNRYPSFMAIVRRELQAALPADRLAANGLRVFTTLDPAVQRAAEEAVGDALARIEQDNAITGLEAALVVASPGSGEIEAAVGGRDVDFAGFDRVSDARRTIGSLMKPVVLLAALRDAGRWSLASHVSDAPLTVPVRGSVPWRPANYDHASHGAPPGHAVMLVDVIASSWNLATARLGLAVGIDRVREEAATLGVIAPLPPYPSVLLGSATLSPREVLAMYQPLAAGGVRIAPHALRGVLDADGRVLLRPRPVAQRVVPEATAFLVTHALREVVGRGTARSAHDVLPRELALAGKTGTTDNARDSWFAGYSGNHVAVAWVGYDDYRATRLSGASGALRVWTGLFARLPQRSLPDAVPEGVEWAWLAPGGTARSTEGCAGAVYLPVIAGTVPAGSTLCGAATRAVEDVGSFFRRLFH